MSMYCFTALDSSIFCKKLILLVAGKRRAKHESMKPSQQILSDVIAGKVSAKNNEHGLLSLTERDWFRFCRIIFRSDSH